MITATRPLLFTLFFSLTLLLPALSSADVGLTGNCQDDIRDLQDEIERDKDDYTAESRAKANAELTVAKTNLVNPVKCRKNIQDARAALRKGKQKKEDRDED